MRYRTSYTSQRKDTKVTNKNSANTFESEPQPTQHNTAYKMTNVHVDEWYELLNIRCYEYLHKPYHISWSDIIDKSGSLLLETQIKVAELRQRNNVNNNINNMFDETIPSNNQTHYVVTLYHTTSTLLIKAAEKQFGLKKNSPYLKLCLIIIENIISPALMRHTINF